MTTHKAVEQYLSRHAEAEVRFLPDLTFGRSYTHVMVIPAFQEEQNDILTAVGRIDEHFLLIVVCNSTGPDEMTARLHQTLTAGGAATRAGNLTLVTGPEHDLLVVDRASHTRFIPKKQGVGLARKIGADIALALIDQHLADSPVIFITDADTHLPSDYFQRVDAVRSDATSDNAIETAAWIYPFDHLTQLSEDHPDRVAMALYEASIHYYAAGLRWADSPYGYTTVGSALALSPGHYAQVRGFPKRNTGEDFHILNKLRKTGRVRSMPLPSTPAIQVSSRLSSRVPIGTGTAVRDITAMSDPINEFLFYDPETFAQLKLLLSEATSRLHEPAPCESDWLPAPSDTALSQVSQQLGVGEAMVRSCRQSSDPVRRIKAFHDWFDGLRTLRLIHGLRDDSYESLPFSRLILLPLFSDKVRLPDEGRAGITEPATESPMEFSKRLQHYLHTTHG
ncbi:MAG: hypothetical protein CMQ05_14685 [Gammaproteobacteria bacterium]|uniref:Glycosyltransferase 2-like domain-containing protein n=1 Tax=OM182 bacterium MED-G24 TaxID=1986255 RepID=A0A2A5WK36_9GAMM|nr:hypothetical protein [Gammaproteobacteria bacterium]PDH36792.1 MAG: hypothetical protein CNE99_09150 [OM182 bacterium MED-G24]RPG25461.1 MAG: hypothetical protein CBC10_007525 [Gammaproteobacteria bacterium TMED50]|tara:strand:+ start:769 stop:2121 length:1353 start_codon:yes stop_codon:yes gene_type:complete